jgi:replication factor A1
MERLDQGILRSLWSQPQGTTLPGSLRLQVLEIKRIGRASSYPYRMAISDGLFYCTAHVCAELGVFFEEGQGLGRLNPYDVIVLEEYSLDEQRGRPVVFVRDMNSTGRADSIIGDPQPLHPNVQEMRPSQRMDPVGPPNNVPAQRLRERRRNLRDSCIPISQLHMYLVRFKILAKIVRKFPVSECSMRNGQIGRKFVIILKDESMAEIRGLFYDTQVDAWFQALKENQVYVISGGNIRCINEGRTASLSQEYEIVFNESSDFMEISEDLYEITTTGDLSFDFRSLVELKTMSVPCFVDIIGYVYRTGPLEFVSVRRRTGREVSHCRHVDIVDMSEMRIELTLWDKNTSILEDNSKVIMAIKDARLTDFMGRSLESTERSIFKIDPEFEKAKTLRQWIRGKSEYDFDRLEGLTRRYCHHCTLILSQVGTYKLGLSKVSSTFTAYVMCANIVGVLDRKLYYPSCPNRACGKKALLDQATEEDGFLCSVCHQATHVPLMRWKFMAYVVDFSGSALVNVLGDEKIGSLFTGITIEEWVALTTRTLDERSLRSLVLKQYFRPLKLRCRARRNSFGGLMPVELLVNTGEVMSYAEGARLFAEEIRKYGHIG